MNWSRYENSRDKMLIIFNMLTLEERRELHRELGLCYKLGEVEKMNPSESSMYHMFRMDMQRLLDKLPQSQQQNMMDELYSQYGLRRCIEENRSSTTSVHSAPTMPILHELLDNALNSPNFERAEICRNQSGTLDLALSYTVPMEKT
jgi:hypothetical protein